MIKKSGLVDAQSIICDCGRRYKHATIIQHIRLYCQKNKDIVNQRKKVKELGSKASSDEWHRKLLKSFL